MIPFVTLVSFTMLGIEAIATEIENPLGIDPSDLPLVCAFALHTGFLELTCFGLGSLLCGAAQRNRAHDIAVRVPCRKLDVLSSFNLRIAECHAESGIG